MSEEFPVGRVCKGPGAFDLFEEQREKNKLLSCLHHHRLRFLSFTTNINLSSCRLFGGISEVESKINGKEQMARKSPATPE